MSDFTGVKTEKGNHKRRHQAQDNDRITTETPDVRRGESGPADQGADHRQQGKKRDQVKNKGQSEMDARVHGTAPLE